MGIDWLICIKLTEMTDAIRVLIVEDHEMVLDGFVAVIDAADHLQIAGTAANVSDAAQLIADVRPDVVITDFLLPDGSGADVAEAANRLSPAPKVLMITGADDRRAVEAAVSSGCSGFLSKGRGVDELITAISSVANGAAVFPAGLLAAVTAAAVEGGSSGLTKRELEILRLLGAAKNADEISNELFLSVHTVRNHIRAVLTKLGARSQLEALVFGIQRGLVSVAPPQ